MKRRRKEENELWFFLLLPFKGNKRGESYLRKILVVDRGSRILLRLFPVLIVLFHLIEGDLGPIRLGKIDQLGIHRPDQEINETSLTLGDVGLLAVIEHGDVKVLLLFKVTLLKELLHDTVNPEPVQVAGAGGIAHIRTLDNVGQHQEHVLLIDSQAKNKSVSTQEREIERRWDSNLLLKLLAG